MISRVSITLLTAVMRMHYTHATLYPSTVIDSKQLSVAYLT
jgi:hypothetical protein